MNRPVSTDLYHHLADQLTTACFVTELTLHDLEQASEDLLMQATEMEWLAADTDYDIRMAAGGYTRTGCRNCDGDLFVPVDEPGPHFCQRCENAGWRPFYPAAIS